MTRYTQYVPFIALQLVTDKWEHPVHNHNYFEIIIIRKGRGTHIVNGIRFNYKENDIFLLAPEDFHSFEIEENTHFCYFKFTEHLFSKQEFSYNKDVWIQKIEAILLNPNIMPGDIRYNPKDKERILELTHFLLDEHSAPNCYQNDIIADYMSLILSLIARNICRSYTNNQVSIPLERDKVNEVLNFVRKHVYESSKMNLDVISKKVGLSKNYINKIFKKSTGESIQQYVMAYRLNLAENRLTRGDYSIKEIAFQLGFTDESHFIKHFKKMYQMNPGEYRKQIKQKSEHPILINS